MKNKIEDIVKSKKQIIKKIPPKDDMLSLLAKNRDEKSIPNNFQERNNIEIENINEDSNEDQNEQDPVKSIEIKVENSARKSFIDNGGFKLPRKKNKAKRYIFLSFLLLIVIFLIFNFFASVKVYITPKIEQFSFNSEKFTANRNSTSSLPFEIMIIEGSEEKDVTFSEIKEIATKAKGTVVLYNEYSTTPQKLLINTRLIDDKGLIYMTDKAVSIPGYIKSTSKVVPGSISVTVTAQNTGDKYNSELKDFKVLGFKGNLKYDKVYARAKTTFVGGAVGNFYIPTATEKGIINTEINTKLKTSLEKKIFAEIPEGYMTYVGSMQFSTSINEESLLSKTKDAKISANGKIATVIFKIEDIKKELIKKAYPNATDMDFKEIDIKGLDGFNFNFLDKTYNITKDAESISFDLTGDKVLEWHPIIESLTKKLSGVSKKEIDNIFKRDTGILRARVVFRPPWQRSMPENVEKIKIIEEVITN